MVSGHRYLLKHAVGADDVAKSLPGGVTRRESFPLLAALLSQKNTVVDKAIAAPTIAAPGAAAQTAAKVVSMVPGLQLPEPAVAKVIQLMTPVMARRYASPQVQDAIRRAAARFAQFQKRSHVGLLKSAMTRARLLFALGKLSDKAVAKLRAAGTLPTPEKYREGLVRGNEAFRKKFKPLEWNQQLNEFREISPERLASAHPTHVWPAGSLPVVTGPADQVAAFWKKTKWPENRHVFGPMQADRDVRYAGSDLTPHFREDLQKIMGAITNRHEFDELRLLTSGKPLPKVTAEGAKHVLPFLSLFSHASPEVVRREGVHALNLDVGGVMRGMRTFLPAETPLGEGWPKAWYAPAQSLLNKLKGLTFGGASSPLANKPLNELELMRELAKRNPNVPYGIYSGDKL